MRRLLVKAAGHYDKPAARVREAIIQLCVEPPAQRGPAKSP